VNNSVLIPLLVLGFIFYVLWRKYSAVKQLGCYTPEFDTYLSEEHPEELKVILVSMYQDSKNHFFLLEVVLYALFSSKSKSKRDEGFSYFKKSFKEDDLRVFYQYMFKFIFVNIKLSPISWGIVALSFLLVVFVVLVVTASFNKVKSISERGADSVFHYIAH
jgi:hypothetical protein